MSRVEAVAGDFARLAGLAWLESSPREPPPQSRPAVSSDTAWQLLAGWLEKDWGLGRQWLFAGLGNPSSEGVPRARIGVGGDQLSPSPPLVLATEGRARRGEARR